MKRPRPRQPVLGLVGLFAIFLLMPGLSWAEPVDAFSIRNIDGEMFDSSAGEGPIIVSFFFPACAPCKEEIQVLHQWVAQELPEASLLFVDRLPDDAIDTIRKYAKGLNVPSTFFYSDASGEATKQFFTTRRFVCPTIIGIKNHTVVFHDNRLTPSALSDLHAALQ